MLKNPAKYTFGSRCFGTRPRKAPSTDFSLSATPFHFSCRGHGGLRQKGSKGGCGGGEGDGGGGGGEGDGGGGGQRGNGAARGGQRKHQLGRGGLGGGEGA